MNYLITFTMLLFGSAISLLTLPTIISAPNENMIPFNPETTIQQGQIDPKKYGRECEYVNECNNIVAINCKAEVDGPFLYVDKNSGEILEYCGGYCMVESEKNCQNCPPKNWNCE